MSGRVGPSCDISLPKEEEQPHEKQSSKQPTPTRRTRGFLTFRQLNCLAIMTVLAASGMVGFQDLALVVFSIIYMHFLSKFAFPTLSPADRVPVFDRNSKILNHYVLFAAIIGLFLPILYVFEGILEGDKEGIKAAVPHVFLLASQVFMEGFSVSDRFSLPIRVFVPVFYNSVRMFTLLEWLNNEMIKVGVGEGFTRSRRLYVGRALAVVNFGFWAYNLLGFLLPVYLPRAFKIYYTADASSSKKD